MHYIYHYQNLTNYKNYVDQTCDLDRRDKEHIKGTEIDSSLLEKAIKKYGRENFSLTLIDAAETQEEADKKEIYWISTFRSYCGREYVYNISDGGTGFSEGHIPWNKGIKQTDNSIIASNVISMMQGKEKNITENGHPWSGKQFSEDHRKKLSMSHIG